MWASGAHGAYDGVTAICCRYLLTLSYESLHVRCGHVTRGAILHAQPDTFSRGDQQHIGSHLSQQILVCFTAGVDGGRHVSLAQRGWLQ